MVMTSEQFQRLTSVQQLEQVFDHGTELLSRIYIFYNIRLYLLYDFFAEVWYLQTTNRVDRIIVLNQLDVLDIYDRQIDLDKLLN